MWGKKNTGAGKRRGVVVAFVIVLIMVLVGALVWEFVTRREGPPSGEEVNPPGCPMVEVLSVPGTWESRANDDPIHPTANPRALLLNVTRPLQARYSASQVKVFTVPYVAQFRNPAARSEASYNESRDQGRDRLDQELTATTDKCPATKFIIVGFSQGAVIAGDVASAIGNGRGPVEARKVLGVALVADGRRQEGQGVNPGVPVKGEGLELTLGFAGTSMGFLSGSDATMRGSRKGGFGELNSKVYQLCASGDVICDSSKNPLDLMTSGSGFFSDNPIHARYATNPNVVPGTTATGWIVAWATRLINSVLT